MSDEKKMKETRAGAALAGVLGRKAGRRRVNKLTSPGGRKMPQRAAKGGGTKTKAANHDRQRPMRVERDTRRRILMAAHREFTEVGLAGARVDRIVELAGVNKRMLYHYFGSKQGLFREMMRNSLMQLSEAAAKAPQGLGDELIYWRDLLRANPDWIRLLLWEALSHKPKAIIGEKERQRFWQSGVDKISQDQKAGRITRKLDSALLQLYLFAFAAFPLILPQMTELITGHSAGDPDFLKRHNAFLQSLSRLLKPI